MALPRRSPSAFDCSKKLLATACRGARLRHERDPVDACASASVEIPRLRADKNDRPFARNDRQKKSGRGGAMNLNDWRRRIDEIDKKLVELLNERSQCALEIGKLKQEAKIPLYQPDRENDVLANAERNNSGPLTDAAIRRLFERIIDEVRAAERDAMHSGDRQGKRRE